MSVATNGAETRANRWAGPCHACGLHVRRNDGTIVREGDVWRLYCAAHRGGSTPPANDRPSNGAPAGSDAPEISEDSARAAIALLRRAATDKRAPEGAVDTATEIATLCVWRTGSAELARELYAALPSKMVAEPADERAADIIGAILDRKGERMICDTAGSIRDGVVTVTHGKPWHGLDGSAMAGVGERVSDADAAAVADAAIRPPIDSHVSRAFAPVRNATVMPAAPKRERSTKGSSRWAHRKGSKG